VATDASLLLCLESADQIRRGGLSTGSLFNELDHVPGSCPPVRMPVAENLGETHSPGERTGGKPVKRAPTANLSVRYSLSCHWFAR